MPPQSSETPTVAVIMSIYRGDSPTAFSQAINSIFIQQKTLTDRINLYLGVDGPISSELAAELDLWREQIYSIHEFPQNRGLAHVLNDLIEQLEDEHLIFRMDADDVCAPERFKRQADFMAANPEVGISGTAIYECEEGREPRIVTYAAKHEEAYRNMCWRSPFAHPTVCFRRATLHLLQRYPAVNANEDIAMWFKAAAAGVMFGNLLDPLLHFKIGRNFWARRGMKKGYKEMLCYLRGIHELKFAKWRFIFPIMRFIFRLSPAWLRRKAYRVRAQSV